MKQWISHCLAECLGCCKYTVDIVGRNKEEKSKEGKKEGRKEGKRKGGKEGREGWREGRKEVGPIMEYVVA